MAIQIECSIEHNLRIVRNNATDMHNWKRLHLWPKLLRINREQLGKELNVTCKQVQKYEPGAHRVSALRLMNLRQILDLLVSYFLRFVKMNDE